MDGLLQQIANGAVLASAYILVAVGLYLIFSVLDIPNFAHGEMFTVGAFTQYALVVQLGVPFWPSLAAAAATAAALGVLLERTVFLRLRAKQANLVAFLIAGLAVGIILQELLRSVFGTDALAVPAPIEGLVTLGPVRMSMYRIVVIAVSLVSVAALGWLVYRSTFGTRLRALALNRDLAALSGINVSGVGTGAFAIGSGLAGLAGGLLSATSSLTPYIGFHPTLVSFVILIMVGAGARLATVLAGGVVMALVESLTAGYIGNSMREAAVFVLLIVFLVWRPHGLTRGADAQPARL